MPTSSRSSAPSTKRRELLRNHLRHCASGAIRKGGEDAKDVCDELIELMYKNAR